MKVIGNLVKKFYQEVPMLEKYISPGDKVEMQSTEVIVLPDGTEGKKSYRTTVFDVLEDGKIEIVMPMEQTKLILLPVNGEYEVCFFTDAGMYKSTVRIVDRQKVNNTYTILTELTSSLAKFQRREYYRFGCIAEMWVKEMTGNEEEAYSKQLINLVSETNLIKSVMVDISGGGLRFVSRQNYEEGATLYLKFELKKDDEKKVYNLAGKVISSKEIENRTDEYENRVKFIHINNSVREEIIKFIFEEERKKRKNGRGRQ